MIFEKEMESPQYGTLFVFTPVCTHTTCVYDCTCVYTPTHTGAHSCQREQHADFPSSSSSKACTRWDWGCYVTEQPPHQKAILTEPTMWHSPGEGTSCLMGCGGAPPPPEQRAETAGSCQAQEPREQMAAAQPPSSPDPWLLGRSHRQQGSCGNHASYMGPPCPLSF
jgi:hypothetical protein